MTAVCSLFACAAPAVYLSLWGRSPIYRRIVDTRVPILLLSDTVAFPGLPETLVTVVETALVVLASAFEANGIADRSALCKYPVPRLSQPLVANEYGGLPGTLGRRVKHRR